MKRKRTTNKVESVLRAIQTGKKTARGQEWKALHKAESVVMYETGRLKRKKQRTKRDLEAQIAHLKASSLGKPKRKRKMAKKKDD